MKLFAKWLKVPESNQTREIEAVQLWSVRWTAREGLSSVAFTRTSPEAEFFTSEQEANDFAVSLGAAFHILRYTGTGCSVVVAKEK